MSDLGYPPAPPAPPASAPPPNRASSDVPLWVVALAIVVALALAGALVFAIVSQSRSSDDAQAAAGKHAYPASWDPRIAPYAKIAAHERGLAFEHPVAVRFQAPAAFEKGLTSDQGDLSAKDKVELQHTTGLLRAFGLIGGDVNLFKAFNDVQGGATLAYYSFKTQRVTVRGHTVTPAVRSTLVHELTHALQDQHFQVGARLKKLSKVADKGADNAAAEVLRAMVEGDAERVQGLYRDSLSPQERAALDRSQQGENDAADQRLAHVPDVVVMMETSPYTLGEGLVQAVAAKGGNHAVDALFRQQPTHESSLLDPFRVLTGATGTVHVARPALHAGEKKFDGGELGVLTWYFMLAQRLPVQQALVASDGWGGDAYVAYSHDGNACARMAYAGRTATDTTHMYDALQGWIAAAPGSPATVTRVGDRLQFQSCDPGTATAGGADRSKEAMTMLAVRTSIGVGLLHSGLPATSARCMAGRMVQTFSVAQLTQPGFGQNDAGIQARLQELAAGCR